MYGNIWQYMAIYRACKVTPFAKWNNKIQHIARKHCAEFNRKLY